MDESPNLCDRNYLFMSFLHQYMRDNNMWKILWSNAKKTFIAENHFRSLHFVGRKKETSKFNEFFCKSLIEKMIEHINGVHWKKGLKFIHVYIKRSKSKGGKALIRSLHNPFQHKQPQTAQYRTGCWTKMRFFSKVSPVLGSGKKKSKAMLQCAPKWKSTNMWSV